MRIWQSLTLKIEKEVQKDGDRIATFKESDLNFDRLNEALGKLMNPQNRFTVITLFMVLLLK